VSISLSKVNIMSLSNSDLNLDHIHLDSKLKLPLDISYPQT